VLRAVLIAVALMFAASSIPDAEAGRKPAVTAKQKKKTVKKRAAKKSRVAKKKSAAKKKRVAKKTSRAAEKTEPRRPLP
jgi:hypothetical protein